MADWKFELWITEDASAEYEGLKAVADRAASVADLRPLPLCADPRFSSEVAAITHFERTRTILKSIVKPSDVGLDKSLVGIFSFVKYRSDLGTCVYFTRLANPPGVLVIGFRESPLDYDALRKLIVSGKGRLIHDLGLPLQDRGAPPPMLSVN